MYMYEIKLMCMVNLSKKTINPIVLLMRLMPPLKIFVHQEFLI